MVLVGNLQENSFRVDSPTIAVVGLLLYFRKVAMVTMRVAKAIIRDSFS